MARTIAVNPAHIYMRQQPELFRGTDLGAVLAAAGSGWVDVANLVEYRGNASAVVLAPTQK